MRWFLSGLLIWSVSAAASVAHDDIVPYAVDNQIVTGGHDDVLGTDTITERVFGLDFGEDPADPYVIGDPGFNNGSFAIGVFPGDGLLPQNITLGFAPVSDLWYWDGADAVDFGPAPTDVSLGLKRGSNMVSISGSGQSGTVPTIGNTGTSGRLHVHLESLLQYADSVDPSAPNAPDGIYLLSLVLTAPGSNLKNSEPFYLVYNNGLSEEVHDMALGWVEQTLVPEPGSAVLGALGLLGLFAVRRRN
ncbi:MAG: hypothetical protein U0795_06455 [Pirellulales bacterium]